MTRERSKATSKQYGKFTEPAVEAGTRTGTGHAPGMHPSSGITDVRGGAPGQTIKRAFALDTSDMELHNEQGLEGFEGGTSNVSHSLKGASAVARNEPTGGKRTGWKWPNH
jgi:hypothetical protein